MKSFHPQCGTRRGGAKARNTLRIKRLDLTEGAAVAMGFALGEGVQERRDYGAGRRDAAGPGGVGGAARGCETRGSATGRRKEFPTFSSPLLRRGRRRFKHHRPRTLLQIMMLTSRTI